MNWQSFFTDTISALSGQAWTDFQTVLLACLGLFLILFATISIAAVILRHGRYSDDD